MALEGMQISHYRLLRLIGSGGMSEVYFAEDTRIPRQVAVKVVRGEAAPYPNTQATQETARLFEREMKAITSLDHPNILPLYDFGEETINATTVTYMVMPFRPEGSLIDWLSRHSSTGVLPPQVVVYIVQEAANALQHAHNHRLMHLDVKPSNFLIRHREDQPQLPDVLLTDFGISKFNTATSTASQSIRGTPTYMAPEQWAGQPVPATDQYALAVMAYQLLTGLPPFQGNMHNSATQTALAIYPNVAGNYNGAVHNTLANITSSMNLSISQNAGQGSFDGFFTVGSPLLGNGPFAGDVDTSGNIQFTVHSTEFYEPLHFTGIVQSNGNMAGTYCSLAAQNQCDPNTGHGTWNVTRNS